MFSPMTPAEVVSAIGQTARGAARSEERASEFSRGQLMSAYSASRHLGVELVGYPDELRRFTEEVGGLLARAAELPRDGRFAAAPDALLATSDAHEIGDIVSAWLDDLRGDPSPEAAAIRSGLQAALRRLADREVELLAEVIEGSRT